MKILVLSLMLFTSAASMAGEVKCGASYAIGLGHFMKGEVTPVGNTEEFSVGATVEDQWTKIETSEVNGEFIFKATDKVTNKELELTSMSALPVYIAKVENVPNSQFVGMGSGKFLFVFCSDM